MIFRGYGDPFMLGPESLDEVRALVAGPIDTAMEGLEYLEHFELTNQIDWTEGVHRSEWFWPMIVGLGFGVRLSVELLNCNVPNADISENLRLYDDRMDLADGAQFAGYELADIVPEAHDVAERVFDPNVLRGIKLYSLPRLNFKPIHEAVFVAAAIHGHGWVRDAFDAWEFNHPVETAERITALHTV